MNKTILFSFILLSTVSCNKTGEKGKTLPVTQTVTISEVCSDTSLPFTFVELFTSESCYDCPEAEVLLNELVDKERAGGRNTVLLASHVDYWNDLVYGEGDCHGSWNDPFSDFLFTARQFAYTGHLQLRPVTPQFFINGTQHIDGADKDSLIGKIEQEYTGMATYGICLSLNPELTDTLKENISVGFKVVKQKAQPESSRERVMPQLVVFLVERGVTSKPDRGENCGKVLHHQNVVRAVAGKTISGNSSGNINIHIPQGVKIENLSVVACVQNLLDMRILAANKGFDLAAIAQK